MRVFEASLVATELFLFLGPGDPTLAIEGPESRDERGVATADSTTLDFDACVVRASSARIYRAKSVSEMKVKIQNLYETYLVGLLELIESLL